MSCLSIWNHYKNNLLFMILVMFWNIKRIYISFLAYKTLRAIVPLFFSSFFQSSWKIFSFPIIFIYKRLNLWYGKTRVTSMSYESWVTSYELRVKSLKTRVEIQMCKFKSTSYEFKLTTMSSNPRVQESFNQWKRK